MPPTGGAGALPPTYVFEDPRGVLLDHVLRADLMLTGLAINSLLFAATAVGFARLLASARRGNLIANGGIGIVSVRGGAISGHGAAA
jgi:ABC-2 type transport system permease protein